ncbi:MAG: exodeoxyribonuclease III [Cytophagaceae bacterium]|nr:exodeoxyribonuclease III [Cytophagaceae bacterium]MDW8455222.1 exodeoxyribonuclease III [Cytophagaceae bacterium]
MKIITYNVNGLRAAIKKGFTDWLKAVNADVVCLQEIKISLNDLNWGEFNELGYQIFLHPAEKKGYSGTAIFTKIQPRHVEVGCGMPEYDKEGRVIRADFEDVSVMCVYVPSGTSGDERQQFKYRWLDYFFDYVIQLKKQIPNLVICGDYNICHKPIDIHNPKSNANSSGFLPEERAWMEKFFTSGYVDAFRYFNQEPHHYTWWSQRFKSIRERNLGWRIDYHAVTEEMKPRLKRCVILPDAKHSDHCPVMLEIN